MIYLELLWSFFQIGLFSIGGGLAALPLIQHQVVDVHGWLSLTAFTDLVTIAEMTPGPIAINSSTFVGIQLAGIPGALVATLGCILPSCIIVSLLAFLYFKYQNLSIIQGILNGLRPAVVALIAAAGLNIFLVAIFGANSTGYSFDNINFIAIALFTVAFIILRKFKPSPILVMSGCGVIGGLIYLVV